MPTPESEQFKAQKPTVAPTFNGVDYDDTKAFKAAEDALIREQWVGAMMTRLVGEELNKCYVREGVNHLENCGHLRERYLQLLKTNKIKGTKFLQQNYVDQKEHDIDLAAKVHTSDKIAKMNHGRFSSYAEPTLSTPVTAPGEALKDTPAPRSSCAAGTVLSGLNYTKAGQDPVAKHDDEYPEWLWDCLDVKKKDADAADADAGDEFSKSKKQRKLAAKRQKAHEAKLLAEGNLDALAPKIPIQQQSVNIFGEENKGVEHNVEAAKKREELKRAMRKERKAKIKETNYLKSIAPRSKGILLPLPARYLLVPPTKSLGFGNKPSSLNCHRGSLITMRPPLAPGVCEGECVGLGDFPPLAVKVNILGSSMEWRREEPRERVVGGGGEGALAGGGGGAALGDA
ncbi:mitochondrial ribosomal l37p [Fusarium longipes]|uniref:Large ribosomal subunit protein mL54 n=1 Tax=Fusarium longipes TaxID=694270 RepID=A0A395RZV1_9HYPO|nr:mitochondrial ribosomal l37p [Fusarium longipes]